MSRATADEPLADRATGDEEPEVVAAVWLPLKPCKRRDTRLPERRIAKLPPELPWPAVEAELLFSAAVAAAAAAATAAVMAGVGPAPVVVLLPLRPDDTTYGDGAVVGVPVEEAEERAGLEDSPAVASPGSCKCSAAEGCTEGEAGLAAPVVRGLTSSRKIKGNTAADFAPSLASSKPALSVFA